MIDELEKAVYIAIKDLREYYMKPGSISWGILFPFVFALAFMFRHGGLTTWLAPGMISLALFFGATSMSGMSIVFERRIGSFERLLLFPISYTGVALGKTLSSFFLGLVSAIPVFLLAYLFIHVAPAHALLLLLAILLVSFSSSSFGVLLSFIIREPEQVMVVMNLVRFPMMFLSDVIIPVSLMPRYLSWIALTQPLTFMTETIRYAYMGSCDIVAPLVAYTVSFIMGLLFLLLAAYAIKRSRA